MDPFLGYTPYTPYPPARRLAEAREEVWRECARLGFPPDLLLRPSPADEHRLRLSLPLVDLGIQERIVNALEAIGVLTVGQALELRVDDLYSMDGMGPGYVREIQTAVARLGFAHSNGRPAEKPRRRRPGPRVSAE
jgi:DNA-directed RNA polymerase alpha subunit